LKSRTARLTGKWSLTHGVLRKKSTDGILETTTFDNGSMVYTNGSSDAETGTYVWTFSFEKNGTYEFNQTIKIDTLIQTINQTGVWSWLGKNKNKNQDLKNKEVLVIAPTSATYNFSGTIYTGTMSNPDFREGLILDKLSSKEMIIQYKTSANHQGETMDSDVSYTFTKE